MNLENFKPMRDLLLVKRDDAATKIGAIYIPNFTQEKSTIGTVAAVGPGRWSEDGSRRIPVCVQPGDRIVFGKYTDFEQDGHVLIMEADIRGVIESDDDIEKNADA